MNARQLRKLNRQRQREAVLRANEGAPVSLEDRRIQIGDAVAELFELAGAPRPDGPRCWWIVATFDDNVIVNVDEKLFKYPVTEMDGEVKLGDPVQVEVVYQNLMEGLRGTAADTGKAVFGGGRLLGPLPEPVTEGVTEAERKERAGSLWAAVAIQAGVSINRNYYSDDVLREAAHLYEGAKVFANHEMRRDVMRDPRDLMGRFREAKYALIEGKGGPVGAVVGQLKITDAAMRERMLEAWEAGETDLFGLSHTADATGEYVKLGDGPAMGVTKIKAVESLDIVSFPSAGGRVMRLVAGLSSPVPVTEEGLVNFEQMLKKLQEGAPDLFKLLSAKPTETEVQTLLKVMEGRTPGTPAPAPAPSSAAPAAPAAPAPVAASVVAAAPALDAATLALLESVKKNQELLLASERRRLIEGALSGVNLPAVALQELREGLEASQEITEETVRVAVAKKVENTAKLLEGVRGFGAGVGAVIEGGTDGAEKALNRLDDLLMTDASPAAVKAYEAIAGRKPQKPDSYSIKECYVAITGDQRAFGRGMVRESLVRLDRYRSVLDKRVVEGRRLVEGTLLTTTWAEIFGDSVARRMLAEYRSDPGMDQWRILASVVPINDFRTQHRIRWGGYADLPVVNQNGTYTLATTPGDEEATYVAQKRGYVEDLAWESIVNDDLGQVRNIPVKMGRAAARTLFKFVTSTLCAANPVMDYDSVALFAVGHSNLITTALSYANIGVARQKLAAQTDMSTNEKLNLRPSWLMVPVDTEELGWRLTNVNLALVSGQNATEASFVKSLGLSTLIVNPYLTDTNDWFVGADKSQCPFIEVGFLYGQEEPTIVIADNETVDPYFNSDKKRLKVRHVYGGDAMDHRGVVGGLV